MMTSCPREWTRFIHPGYRHLIPWCKPFQGIVVKRSLVTRIRNHYVYYFPFPRVFPYFCDNCQTNTPSLEIIQNHNCVRRKPRDFDPENEQKIITLGYRSKAKDRLAVMERLPNPQHYQVVSYHFHNEDDPVIREQYVPTLAEICVNQSLSLQKIDETVDEPDETVIDLGKCKNKVSEHCMCLTCGLEFETAPEYFEHLSVEPECLENRQNPLLLTQC
ncbi:unnamed protein product, partial [Mesorhabditis belari]|uniref:Uncharacterized protein n=1 Tax=Mesorhabditis belari TaxID=2138241 RepID=A0AAF3F709_9BILA